MSNLPVYFEQRLVGTIDVDKSGPGFRYDAAWIGLRGSFPISTTMPFTVERIAADTFLKRAIAHPWSASWHGTERRYRPFVRDRRRYLPARSRLVSPRGRPLFSGGLWGMRTTSSG
jgi:hypothetical protein